MTDDLDSLAVIILDIHPAHKDLYKSSSYGSWRSREWNAAMKTAKKIVAAGFTSVNLTSNWLQLEPPDHNTR